jgi:hypothetical protein
VYSVIYGPVTISESLIANNSAYDEGAGIASFGYAPVTISGTTIVNNSAIGSFGVGAGMSVDASTVLVTKTTIANNFGGGASIFPLGTVADSTITGNVGCGINADEFVSVVLANNIVVSNQGPGICLHGEATLTNNTIAYNSSGVSWRLYGTANLYNNIIWGNGIQAPLTAESTGRDLYIDNDTDGNSVPSPVNLFHNDFDQGPTGTYIKIPFPIDASNLNNVDPLFVSPGSGDYRLQGQSPVINQGDNAAPSLPPTDKAGNPRIIHGVVDMGALEYTSCFLNVRLSKDAGTLNIGFDLGTEQPAQWSTHLASRVGLRQLWSRAVPVIEPPANFTVPIPNFPSIGMVGVLSVLTASPQGLLCWDFAVTDTGGAGATVEELRELVRRSVYAIDQRVQ